MINKNIKIIEDFFLKYEKKYLHYIENNYLYVTYPFYKTIKIPTKKEINEEWMFNKLNNNKEFVNLSKIIKNLNLDGVLNYPASYGIGVLILNGFFSLKSDIEIKKIKDFLDKNDINYKWEYSEKCLVYRFKISKSEENLNKLKHLSVKNEQN